MGPTRVAGDDKPFTSLSCFMRDHRGVLEKGQGTIARADRDSMVMQIRLFEGVLRLNMDLLASKANALALDVFDQGCSRMNDGADLLSRIVVNNQANVQVYDEIKVTWYQKIWYNVLRAFGYLTGGKIYVALRHIPVDPNGIKEAIRQAKAKRLPETPSPLPQPVTGPDHSLEQPNLTKLGDAINTAVSQYQHSQAEQIAQQKRIIDVEVELTSSLVNANATKLQTGHETLHVFPKGDPSDVRSKILLFSPFDDHSCYIRKGWDFSPGKDYLLELDGQKFTVIEGEQRTEYATLDEVACALGGVLLSKVDLLATLFSKEEDSVQNHTAGPLPVSTAVSAPLKDPLTLQKEAVAAQIQGTKKVISASGRSETFISTQSADWPLRILLFYDTQDGYRVHRGWDHATLTKFTLKLDGQKFAVIDGEDERTEYATLDELACGLDGVLPGLK